MNIAVETGWLGLVIFLWWLSRVITLAIRKWRADSEVPTTLRNYNPGWVVIFSAGIVGWQIAGLVEYNFGDGEIVLIAWLFLGLLLSACEQEPPKIKASKAG